VVKQYTEVSPQAAANSLQRLALLLTQRQLEVQKAFAGLDEQRQGSIEPVQLVISTLDRPCCPTRLL